ncbi:MAG: glutamate racemase [Patescibacteria group bacterium]
MRLGVFDSGIGGKSVASHLQLNFPDADILYVDDHKNVPYGTKAEDEIVRLTDAAIQPLLTAQCDIIILACNTATAAAIKILRAKYPEQNFIGLEPMVKTATELTKTGVITMCATPYTLQSKRYLGLKAKFARDTIVIEPSCSQWASMIEHNEIDDDEIQFVVAQALKNNSDVIVLACTHYHWIKERIIQLASDKVQVIDPSEAIARRVKQLLGI